MAKKEKGLDLVEQARQLRLQAEELEKSARARFARGTKLSVAPDAGRIVAKPAPSPHWTGDEGPTEALMTSIQMLLIERPRRFVELLEATGARDNRIKGVIMRLQREGVNVVDIAPPGTGKALWFIPSIEAVARLARPEVARVTRAMRRAARR